jgi:SET family sugar efflux transporter-like MFS transporter
MSCLLAIYIPVFPLWVAKEIRLPISTVFFIVSVLGIFSAVANIYIGHLTDRIGKRKLVLQIGIFMQAVRAVLFALFPSIVVVFCTSWVTQISNGSLPMAMLSDKIKEHDHLQKEGIILATMRISVSAGYILGPPLGIMLLEFISFKAFFILFAACYLILGLYIGMFLQDGVALQRQKKESLVTVNLSLTVMALILFVLLFTGNIVNVSLVTLYINSTFGMLAIALVLSIGPLFELVVFPLVGLLNDKLGIYRTLLLGAAGEFIYFVLMSLGANYYFLLAIQVFGTFYTAVLFTSLMMYVQNLFKDRPGFSSSLYFSGISLSIILGNAALGTVLLKWGYDKAFLLLAGMAFLAFFLLITQHFFISKGSRLKRKERDHEFSNHA